MIIKSMTRKDPSFSQILKYVNKNREGEKFNVYQNFDSFDDEGVLREFEENAEYVRDRANGVYMYHEILSISQNFNLSKDEQKSRLKEIAQEYIKARAGRNKVFGVLHEGKNNIHYHFVISANEAGVSKKPRLSKQKFDEIKKGLERWVLEKYQELEQKEVMQKKAGMKISNKGGELKRRTGETPQRNRVETSLKKIFARVETKQDFFEALHKEKIEIYVRGSTIGFRDLETGRNHRLKTLGLESEFQTMSRKIELEQVAEKNEHERSQPRPGPEAPKQTAEERGKPGTDTPRQATPEQRTKQPGDEQEKAYTPDAVSKAPGQPRERAGGKSYYEQGQRGTRQPGPQEPPAERQEHGKQETPTKDQARHEGPEARPPEQANEPRKQTEPEATRNQVKSGVEQVLGTKEAKTHEDRVAQAKEELKALREQRTGKSKGKSQI